MESCRLGDHAFVGGPHIDGIVTGPANGTAARDGRSWLAPSHWSCIGATVGSAFRELVEANGPSQLIDLPRPLARATRATPSSIGRWSTQPARGLPSSCDRARCAAASRRARQDCCRPPTERTRADRGGKRRGCGRCSGQEGDRGEFGVIDDEAVAGHLDRSYRCLDRGHGSPSL